MAKAAFVVLYRGFAGEEKGERARQELGVDMPFVRYVDFLIKALTPKRH